MRTRPARLITRFVAAAAMAAVVAGGAAAGVAGAQDDQTGLVRVVHGLRGLVADIYLDGTLALPTFQPERSTDPLPIPAGDHLVEIRAAGAAISDEPLLTQTVTVPAGFEGSLVAHLDAAGQPTLTAFADDLSAVPAGQSRLVVRHAAAAEDVSVLLNEQPAIPSITSKSEAEQELGAGTYQVAVAPAAGGSVLAAPQTVEYADGTANFMYLIGSQPQGTLGWAVVQVGGLESAPVAIQTGDGSTLGSGDDGGLQVALIATAALVGAGGVAAVGVRLRRARGFALTDGVPRRRDRRRGRDRPHDDRRLRLRVGRANGGDGDDGSAADDVRTTDDDGDHGPTDRSSLHDHISTGADGADRSADRHVLRRNRRAGAADGPRAGARDHPEHRGRQPRGARRGRRQRRS